MKLFRAKKDRGLREGGWGHTLMAAIIGLIYFTPVLWPEFSPATLDQAIADFAGRERRFGRTGQQARQAGA